MSAVGTAILGGLILYLSWRLLRLALERYKRVASLAWIPNEFALPILGNSIQLNIAPKDFFKLLVRNSKVFDRLYKFWIGLAPIVISQETDIVQNVLKCTINIKKGVEYDFLKPYIGEGLLISTGSKWHQRRKMLTPCFHLELLENMTFPISEAANILVKKLHPHMIDQQVFDIMPYVKLCALDVIMDTSIGRKTNAQSYPQGEYVQAINKMSKILMKRSTTIVRYDFIFRLSSQYKEQEKATKIIHEFSSRAIREKRLERKLKQQEQKINPEINELDSEIKKKKRMVLLDLLLETEENGDILTDADIQEEVDTFVFEGHDTTSSGVSFAYFLLGHHPEVQERILRELEEFAPEFPQKNMTLSQMNKLEYLDRVVKEVLRLYPPVVLISRDLTKPIETGKGIIPPGTTLVINIYNLHRDPNYFSNPDVFDPDRFLPDKIVNKHPFSYVPFSAGPRNCIGQKFALMEMKILIATLLKSYIIESVEAPQDIDLVANVIITSESGIRVKLKERK